MMRSESNFFCFDLNLVDFLQIACFTHFNFLH
jgi:hypothetical protein